jgi:hypothetical protein
MQTRLWWRLWWGLVESAFGRNLASVSVKMSAHLIYFINKFNKSCISNAICKDNAGINYISVQRKKADSREI